MSKEANDMNEFPVVSTGENVTRQVLSDYPDLPLVTFGSMPKEQRARCTIIRM
jgi:hypothetical protein